IQTLARKTAANRHNAQPLLAILDQRLLYWPIGSAGIAVNTAVSDWSRDMSGIRDAGALLCGYIDRPGTSSVMMLLRSIVGLSDAQFNWKELGQRKATQGVTDADVFSQILGPGERSAVFANISDANDVFMAQDPANE